MKILDIRDCYNDKYREYIVGSAATGRHGVYLVYGEAAKDEKREMSPVVPLDPDGSFTFTALTDCRYLVAGTHITPHEH